MKITIKSSTIVKPASETPQCVIWNSNIDMVIPRIHIPTVYFYKVKAEDEKGGFFESGHLKESLGRALVPFYPMAGRLKEVGKGRMDIECNGEGALFVEASADGCMSEYGDYFAPSMRMRQLIPHIDYSKGHASFPLLILQLTVFKCGGVSVGVGVHHHVADGLGALRFLNYWADLGRGVEEEVKPFFDRTLLRARDPPKPKFEHVEYQPPPPLLNVNDGDHVTVNSDYSRVNGDYSKMNGDYSKVDSEYRKVNGDYSEQPLPPLPKVKDLDHVKVSNDYSNVNGNYSKVNGDHSKMNSEYSKVNGDYSEVNGDYNKVNGKYSEVNNEYIKVNGDCIKKQEPYSKKLRKEEERERILEEIAKINEEKKDNEEEVSPVAADLFIFSKEQVLFLKNRAAENAFPGERPFTSYEVLSAHVWRCTCLARDLQDSQSTKLYIATDGRNRLQPALPSEYFGNVIFTAAPVERVGRLVDVPLADVARYIRKTVQIMDDEYLRSALDYLELQPNLEVFSRGAHTFRTPNLGITSWVRLPIYGADFGWGPPLSMGPAGVPFEGLAYLLPGPPGDTRLRLSITLSPNHMLRFRELIYRF